jgi:hypothetical protein
MLPIDPKHKPLEALHTWCVCSLSVGRGLPLRLHKGATVREKKIASRDFIRSISNMAQHFWF